MVDTGHIQTGGPDTPQSLIGTVVRYAIPAGQPVTRSALVKPGDHGFLAPAPGPGMTPVTVQASASSGVGGFLFPCDSYQLFIPQDVWVGGVGSMGVGYR